MIFFFWGGGGDLTLWSDFSTRYTVLYTNYHRSRLAAVAVRNSAWYVEACGSRVNASGSSTIRGRMMNWGVPWNHDQILSPPPLPMALVHPRPGASVRTLRLHRPPRLVLGPRATRKTPTCAAYRSNATTSSPAECIPLTPSVTTATTQIWTGRGANTSSTTLASAVATRNPAASVPRSWMMDITADPPRSLRRRRRRRTPPMRRHLRVRPTSHIRVPLLNARHPSSSTALRSTEVARCGTRPRRDLTTTRWNTTRRTNAAPIRPTDGIPSRMNAERGHPAGAARSRPTRDLPRPRLGNSCPRAIRPRRGPQWPPTRGAGLRPPRDAGQARSSGVLPRDLIRRADRVPPPRLSLSAQPVRSHPWVRSALLLR